MGRVAFLLLILGVSAWRPASADQVTPRDSTRLRAEAESSVSRHIAWVRPVTARSRETARESRPSVIANLDAVAESIPGDDWVAGHRVGMRVKQGQVAEAVEVARACRATDWWCAALAGFALHVAGEYVPAGEAFDDALRLMPFAQRCEWLGEVRRHLLSGGYARTFGASDCGGMIAAEPRLWWLADPLHLLPGNDRRTEHYTRLVAMRLHHEALHLNGGTCQDLHHESQIKQGWPEWWWSVEASITSLRAGPGYGFMPRGNAGLRPLESSLADWSLSAGAYDERYNPPYGPVLPLDQQTAFFLRGDSIEVVAAAEPDQRLLGDGEVTPQVGLILSQDERTSALIRGDAEGSKFLFRTRTALSRYLVSVEAIAPGVGAARSRFGHGLPGEPGTYPAISDILLWDWEDGVAQELDAVAPRTVGTTRIAADRPLGIYWEVYGLAAGDALLISVSAIPPDGGLIRRLGERLRLVGPRESLRFVWREGVDEDAAGVLGRTLALDLTSLESGPYTLELTVETEDGGVAASRRRIELMR